MAIKLELTEQEIVILKRGIEAFERSHDDLELFQESNDLWIKLDDAHVRVLEVQ